MKLNLLKWALYALVPVCLMVSATGCDDDDDLVPEIALKTSTGGNSANFAATAGDQTLALTSNTSWQVTVVYDGDVKDWIKVEPSTGSGDASVKVTVIANPDESARKAILTAATGIGNATSEFTVNQAGINEEIPDGEYLRFDGASNPQNIVNIAADGNNYDINVLSNVTWKYSIVSADTDEGFFGTITPAGTEFEGDQTLKVNVTGHNGQESRKGKIEIVSVDAEETITLTVNFTQLGAEEPPVVNWFRFKDADEYFDGKVIDGLTAEGGETFSIDVESTVTWYIEVSGDTDLFMDDLRPYPTRNVNGDGTITFTVALNDEVTPREAQITLKTEDEEYEGDKEMILTFKQEPKPAYVSVLGKDNGGELLYEATLGGMGTTYSQVDLQIEANVPWEARIITSTEEMYGNLSISGDDATELGTVYFYLYSNTTTVERTLQVVLNAKDRSAPEFILNLVQDAYEPPVVVPDFNDGLMYFTSANYKTEQTQRHNQIVAATGTSYPFAINLDIASDIYWDVEVESTDGAIDVLSFLDTGYNTVPPYTGMNGNFKYMNVEVSPNTSGSPRTITIEIFPISATTTDISTIQPLYYVIEQEG